MCRAFAAVLWITLWATGELQILPCPMLLGTCDACSPPLGSLAVLPLLGSAGRQCDYRAGVLNE